LRCPRRIFPGYNPNVAVTLYAKLSNATSLQQLGICGAVGIVTSSASLNLQRRMFEDEWSLLVRMAFVAGGVGSGSESCLFQLEPSMRIVAIAAVQHPFQHLVMER